MNNYSSYTRKASFSTNRNSRFSSSKPSFGNNSRKGGYRGRGGGGGGRSRQFIDTSKYVKTATAMTSLPYVATNQFSDFEVYDILKRNIAEKGYVTPLPIQDQTIPIALSGRDIIGIANTGTGKTAAFLIPLINKVLDDHSQKVLIIAPTRELAQQIDEEFVSFAKDTGMKSLLLIGGTPMFSQISKLRYRNSFIIGTPGRIKDHVQRGTLNLSDFHNIVLDECDRMVDMGFIDDIRMLLSKLSTERQSFFFTATLEPSIESLVKSFSIDPVTISVKSGETSASVNQDIIHYETESDKIEKLHEALIKDEFKKTLIFNETKIDVEKLHKELEIRGFKVESIHGNKTQGQRLKALRKFKSSEVDILVATDVAARGLDISGITHVINYSLPRTSDDYTHRIGRAGRAGNVGQAYTFVRKTVTNSRYY